MFKLNLLYNGEEKECRKIHACQANLQHRTRLKTTCKMSFICNFTKKHPCSLEKHTAKL